MQARGTWNLKPYSMAVSILYPPQKFNDNSPLGTMWVLSYDPNRDRERDIQYACGSINAHCFQRFVWKHVCPVLCSVLTPWVGRIRARKLPGISFLRKSGLRGRTLFQKRAMVASQKKSGRNGYRRCWMYTALLRKTHQILVTSSA